MWQGHNLNARNWPTRPRITYPKPTQKKETKPVSMVLWCDKGDHAFSAKDPDKRHFSQTRTVEYPTGNSYGRTTYSERQEVTDELDICGPCWKKGNDFEPRKAVNGPDNESLTLDEMERNSDEWAAGYTAGMDAVLRVPRRTDNVG